MFNVILWLIVTIAALEITYRLISKKWVGWKHAAIVTVISMVIGAVLPFLTFGYILFYGSMIVGTQVICAYVAMITIYTLVIPALIGILFGVLFGAKEEKRGG